MVHDGAIPKLRVGDSWVADLVFSVSSEMAPATASSPQGFRREAALDALEDFGPRYRVTARVLRTTSDTGVEDVALATPSLTVGVGRSSGYIPDEEFVSGFGVLTVDPWDPSWGFKEASRRCRVRKILSIMTATVEGEPEPRRHHLEELVRIGDESIPEDWRRMAIQPVGPRQQTAGSDHFVSGTRARLDTNYVVDVEFY